MVKRSGFITRRPDLSVAAFQRHWLDVHAPLVTEVARPRRYVVNLVDRRRFPGFPFDGFSELWFEEEADWDVLLAPGSPVKEDERNFTLTPNGVALTEHVIVPGS